MTTKREALKRLQETLILITALDECTDASKVKSMCKNIGRKSTVAMSLSQRFVSMSTLDDETFVLFLSARFLVRKGSDCLLSDMDAVHDCIALIEAALGGNTQEAA